MTTNRGLLVGLVGPCASGKSTIRAILENHGVLARAIAQEHSYVPDMWRRITNPDILIYLDASYPVTCARRNLTWTQRDYDVQVQRLKNARENASLYLFTDPLTAEEVSRQIISFLNAQTGL